jgi:hypothetical protein
MSSENDFDSANRTPPASAGVIGNGNRPAQSRAAQFISDREGNLPVWVRAPKFGHEFYSGCSRPKLYEWAAKGLIRSVSIREPGRIKGRPAFPSGQHPGVYRTMRSRYVTAGINRLTRKNALPACGRAPASTAVRRAESLRPYYGWCPKVGINPPRSCGLLPAGV